MSREGDNNLDCLICPICHADVESRKVDEMDEFNDEIFIECEQCGAFIKISLEIIENYEYSAEIPTEEDLKKIEDKKNKIEDIPGQTLMWGDMYKL